MRIAVLSDIHGNLPALEAVLRDMRDRGADAVVNLGDSLSGPLLPRETAQFLMARGWPTIAGNHERQILTQGPAEWGPSDAYAHSRLAPAELEWIGAQPPTLAFNADVFMCHGTPDSDLDSLLDIIEPAGMRAASAREVDARLGGVRAPVVLCGHTHMPRSVRSSSGQLIVNPGSVGLPALVTTVPHAVRVETGSPDARYALIDRRAGGWVAALLSVPYEYGPMAELARSRNRPDWACALRSGYMD